MFNNQIVFILRKNFQKHRFIFFLNLTSHILTDKSDNFVWKWPFLAVVEGFFFKRDPKKWPLLAGGGNADGRIRGSLFIKVMKTKSMCQTYPPSQNFIRHHNTYINLTHVPFDRWTLLLIVGQTSLGKFTGKEIKSSVSYDFEIFLLV